MGGGLLSKGVVAGSGDMGRGWAVVTLQSRNCRSSAVVGGMGTVHVSRGRNYIHI